MSTKLIVVLLGVLLLGFASVDAHKTWMESRTGTKASTITAWLTARAKALTDKISSLVAKLKINKPFNEAGNPVDATGKEIPYDDATVQKNVQAALDSIDKGDDGLFQPDNPALKGKSPDEAHTNAILEAANGIIKPADPLSNDPDNDIDQAVAESSGTNDFSPLAGIAAKALVRADASASTADDSLLTPPSDSDIGTDGEEGDAIQDTSFLESNSRVRRRRRKGTFVDFVKKASGAFVKVLKGMKHLIPQGISAGIGGNLGPLAVSADLGFDMNTELMGAVTCVGALIGTDVVGIAGNYHMQLAWYGKNQYKSNPPKFDDVWAGFAAGVTAAVGLSAAGFPISVGGAISWGANGAKEAWIKFAETLKDNHKKNPALVTDPGSGTATINFKTLGKDIVALKDALVTSIQKSLPNVDDPIVVNAAIGVGISASTLAAGGDITFTQCITPWVTKKPVKLWKLLAGLFLVAGPPGVIAGLFSWLTYHADVVAKAFAALKDQFAKVGQAISTFAKGLKNFWVGRILPATKDVLAKLSKVDKALTDAATKALATAKEKIVYIFPKGSFLKDLISAAKTKIINAGKAVIGKLKSIFSSKKKKL